MKLFSAVLLVTPLLAQCFSGILLHTANFTEVWSPLGQVQSNLHYGIPEYDTQTAVFFNGKVYFLAGSDRGANRGPTADVWILDPVTETTVQAPPMTTDGQNGYSYNSGAIAGVITLPNGMRTILACGGTWDVSGVSNGCSMMMLTGEWIPVPGPSKTQAVGTMWSTMTVINGKAFVIGGSSPNRSTTTTEVNSYDPATNAWTLESVYTTRHLQGHSAISLDGTSIYIVGGADYKLESSREAMTYHTVTKVWTVLPQEQWLNIPRDTFRLVQLQSRLYAIGGLNNGRVQQTTEVRDIGSTMWSSSSQVFPHFLFAAVTVPAM